MANRPPHLPDFENPPVVEVVLSVQFERILGFQTPQIGLLWTRFRPTFPKVEEKPPLEPSIEKFDMPQTSRVGIRFETFDVPPQARVLFANQSESQLIQVQPDRFIHNWRKSSEREAYPRYETIRDAFLDEISIFERFLSEESLSPLKVVQCELTYVNHIKSEQVWNKHGEIDRVFTIAAPSAGTFLPPPEDAIIYLRHIIASPAGPAGRLNTSIQPGWRRTDGSPIFVMELVARGAPVGSGLDGVRAFFDLGHEWIVRGFKDLTTPAMHQAWRQING